MNEWIENGINEWIKAKQARVVNIMIMNGSRTVYSRQDTEKGG